MILIFKVQITMTLLYLISQSQSLNSRQRRRQSRRQRGTANDNHLANQVDPTHRNPASDQPEYNIPRARPTKKYSSRVATEGRLPQNFDKRLPDKLSSDSRQMQPLLEFSIEPVGLDSDLSVVDQFDSFDKTAVGGSSRVGRSSSDSNDNADFIFDSHETISKQDADVNADNNKEQLIMYVDDTLDNVDLYNEYQKLFNKVLNKIRLGARPDQVIISASRRRSRKTRRKVSLLSPLPSSSSAPPIQSENYHSSLVSNNSRRNSAINDHQSPLAAEAAIAKKRAYLANEITSRDIGFRESTAARPDEIDLESVPHTRRLRHQRRRNRIWELSSGGRRRIKTEDVHSLPLTTEEDKIPSRFDENTERIDSTSKHVSYDNMLSLSDTFKRAMANYRSLCAIETRTVVMNNDEYDYVPPFYSETLCFHKYKNGTQINSHKQRCAVDFLDCVQQHQVLRFTRRRANSEDRWEPYSLEVPSRCECMWPLDQNGPLKLHHDHEDL